MDIWQIQTEYDSYANVISMNNVLGMEHSHNQTNPTILIL